MNTIHTPKNKMTGIAQRGGIETDGMEKYPDANYWAMGAKGAVNRIRKITGCIHEKTAYGSFCRIDNLLSEIWAEDRSWMEICMKTEHVRDLLIKIQGNK